MASQKEGPVWEQLIAGWEAKLAGDTTNAEQRFAAARDLAAARGFRYMRADEVAKPPTNELLKRVDSISGTDRGPDLLDAAGMLGGAKEPEVSVSRALELFWDLARDQIIGKSPDQIRRWRNSIKKAVETFIAAVGDRGLSAQRPVDTPSL